MWSKNVYKMLKKPSNKLTKLIFERAPKQLLRWWSGLNPSERKEELRKARQRAAASKYRKTGKWKKNLENYKISGAMQAAQQRFHQTEKGKICLKRARQNPKGKRAKKRYQTSKKGRETREKYLQTREGKEKARESAKKYRQTERGKEVYLTTLEKWRKTPKGKAARQRYQQSEKGREAATRYHTSPKGRAAKERYLRKRNEIKEMFKVSEETLQLRQEHHLSPLNVLLEKEFIRSIHDALEAIPPEEHLVVKKLFFENNDEPQDELSNQKKKVARIAERMRKTPEEINIILSSAFKKLRKTLRKNGRIH